MKSVFSTFSGIPNNSNKSLGAAQVYQSTSIFDAPLMIDEEWTAMTLEQQAQQAAFESKLVADCRAIYNNSVATDVMQEMQEKYMPYTNRGYPLEVLK